MDRPNEAPPKAPPPYFVVMHVKPEEFEKAVNDAIFAGYVPAGGLVVFPRKTSPLAGAPSVICFAQAMFLAADLEAAKTH